MAEISILMPIYNAEKYLQDCLTSISNQYFRDFEVLMIVDGGTDSSLNICEAFADRDNRFKVRNQVNQGSGRTRNNLIDWAMETISKYIIWIDADDIIHPMYLEYLHQSITEHPEIDIVQCRYTSTFSELLNSNTSLVAPYTVLNNEQLLMEMVSGSHGIDFTVLWNKIYRKDLYQHVRMRITEKFSGRMQDDVNILAQIYKISKGAYLITEVLYFYRIVNNSIQHKKLSEINLEYLYIYRDLYLECQGTDFDTFANFLSERILFELASKFQKRKSEYEDYYSFYKKANQIFIELQEQIHFVCRRIDIRVLYYMSKKVFYSFRIYAFLYGFRKKIKSIFE